MLCFKDEGLHCCINHLNGELPRMEVSRTLERSPDLPETGVSCPGYAIHEKET